MPLSAIAVDNKDNVATAVRQLIAGDSIDVDLGGTTINILLSQSIPFGHKLALKDIEQGEKITKYGDTIGLATVKIKKGEHVHVHNVEGLRGRGDKQ